MAKNRPSTLIWCMGHAEERRHGQRARLQHPAAGAGQHRRGRRRGQHLSRPLQRPGCHRHGPRCVHPALLLRPDRGGVAALRPGLGRRLRVPPGPLRLKELMEKKGIPTTRWFDAVLAQPGEIDQPSPLQAMICFGHGGNTVTRMAEMAEGLGQVEAPGDRRPASHHLRGHPRAQERHLLLPACTQFETEGSRVCSNRSISGATGSSTRSSSPRTTTRSCTSWPEARLRGPDVQAHQGRAQPAGARGHPARDQPGLPVDGYTGCSPERLKLHMEHQADFDRITMQATQGPPGASITACPGRGACRNGSIRSPILYDTSRHVMEGGGVLPRPLRRRADGVSLLAEGSYSKGSRSRTATPSSPWPCSRSWAGTRS